MRQLLILHFDGAGRVFGLAFGFGDARVNADDLGVRVWRAHDLAEEHSGAVDVESVFRPARDLVRSVDARDALADVSAFAFFGPFVLSHCSCLLSSISPAPSSAFGASVRKPARWRP